MKAGGGKGGTFHSPVEKKPLCGQESREHREWSAQDTHEDANVGCRAVCVNSARTVPRGVRGVIPASTQVFFEDLLLFTIVKLAKERISI